MMCAEKGILRSGEWATPEGVYSVWVLGGWAGIAQIRTDAILTPKDQWLIYAGGVNNFPTRTKS